MSSEAGIQLVGSAVCGRSSSFCLLGPNKVALVAGNGVAIVDVAKGSVSSYIPAAGRGIEIIARGPGSTLAYADAGLTPSVHLVDIPSGKERGMLPSVADIRVSNIAFSHDGSRCATLGGLPEFRVTLWELSKFSAICRVELPVACSSISFSPTSSSEVCLSGGGVFLFGRLASDTNGSLLQLSKASTGEDQVPFGSSHAWGADGVVFGGSTVGEIWSFDSSTGAAVSHPTRCASGPISCILVSQSYVVCTSESCLNFFTPEEMVKCYSVEIDGVVDSAVWDADCTGLYVCLKDSRILSIKFTGELPRSPLSIQEGKESNLHSVLEWFSGHSGKILSIASSSDPGTVAVVSSDGVVAIWDVTEGHMLARRQLRTCPVSVSCLGKGVLVGDEDGFLRLFEFPTLAVQGTTSEWHLSRKSVRACLTSPNGKWVAALCDSDDDRGRVWFLGPDSSGQIDVVGYVPLEKSASLLTWVDHDRCIAVNDAGLAFILPPPTRDGVNNYCLSEQAGVMLLDHPVSECCCRGDSLLCVGKDNQLRHYSIPEQSTLPSVSSVCRKTKAGKVEHSGHFSSSCYMLSTGDGVVSGGRDGSLLVHVSGDCSGPANIRSVLDGWHGGISCLCDIPSIGLVAGGCDGSILTFEHGKRWPKGSLGRSTPISAHRDTVQEVGATEQPTFLELKMGEARQVQEAVHAAVQGEMLHNVQSLRNKLNSLLEVNKNLDDMEKLEREDFIIDFESRDKLLKEGEKKVTDLRQAIRFENSARDLVRERIKTFAWNDMQQVIQGVESFDGIVSVLKFPIKKREEEIASQIDRLHVLRLTEEAELSILQERGCVHELHTDLEVSVVKADASNEDVDAPMEDGETPADNSEAVMHGQGDGLSYSQFAVTALERRLLQAQLTQERVTALKEEFNQRVDKILDKKKDVIGRVEEKNGRIQEILLELELKEDLISIGLSKIEVPQRLLEVDDAELSSERVLSAEQREAAEKEAESSKKKGEGGNEAIDRALKQMMGGTLDSGKAISKLQQRIERPDWMKDLETDDMTDEQLKELKEVEAAEKNLLEDQSRYRKSLEGELKKLRAEAKEIMSGFSENLAELRDLKSATQFGILREELAIVKLFQLAAAEDFHEKQCVSAQRVLQEAESLKAKTGLAAESAEALIVEARSNHEAAVANDRALEKQMKKDFYQDLPPAMADSAFKLLRLKVSGDEAACVTLDESYRPEEWEDLLWKRLLSARQERWESDLSVRRAAERLRLATEESEIIFSEDTAADTQLARAKDALVVAEQDRRRDGVDLDVVQGLKQGQLEVQQAAVVTDYSDAVFVNMRQIESVNTLIRGLGSEKVKTLEEIKEFRRGIHKLKWENEVLDVEEEGCTFKIRDLQLLRVTKSLQDIIRGGESGNAAKNETSTLERLLEYNEKLHVAKITERRTALQKLDDQIVGMQRENKDLDEDAITLDAAVVERAKLRELQGSKEESVAVTASRQKMKTVVTQRKLLDLAKAQTREIELMREELVRLRARTFPSFAQLGAARSVPDAV